MVGALGRSTGTRSAGNSGPVEVERETFVNGISAGVDRSPTYGGRVRAMERAESRVRQASRMLGMESSLNPHLAFDTTAPAFANVHTYEPRWAKIYHRFMFAIFFVGAAGILVAVLACTGLF